MITFILNDAPYGNERSYNGLRLAMAMTKGGAPVRVFLMADAVACAVEGQQTPNGYYNIGRMLQSLLRNRAEIAACGSCCDARGIREELYMQGIVKGTMEMLADWVNESRQTIVF